MEESMGNEKINLSTAGTDDKILETFGIVIKSLTSLQENSNNLEEF